MCETVQVKYFVRAEKIAERLKALNEAVFASPVYNNYEGRRKEALAMQGVTEHAGVRQLCLRSPPRRLRRFGKD
jgi:hypothetical protein